MSFENIKKEFSSIESWEDRYKLLIQKGKKLKNMPDKYKTDQYKVKGCQSQVWLYPELANGTVNFLADSDSTLVRGIVALLLEMYSGLRAKEILTIDEGQLKEIGITDHLSMNRSNGLASMVKQIKMYAFAYQFKES